MTEAPAGGSGGVNIAGDDGDGDEDGGGGGNDGGGDLAIDGGGVKIKATTKKPSRNLAPGNGADDAADGGGAGESKTNVGGPDSAPSKSNVGADDTGNSNNADDDPDASATNKKATNGGLVVGIVLALLLIIALLLYILCWKSNDEDADGAKGGAAAHVVANPLDGHLNVGAARLAANDTYGGLDAAAGVEVHGDAGAGGAGGAADGDVGSEQRIAANTTYIGVVPAADELYGVPAAAAAATKLELYDNANNNQYDSGGGASGASAAAIAAAAAGVDVRQQNADAVYEEVSEDPVNNGSAGAGGDAGAGGGGTPVYAEPHEPMSIGDRNRGASNASVYSYAEHTTPPRRAGSTAGGTVYAQLTPPQHASSPMGTDRNRGGSDASVYSVADHSPPPNSPSSPQTQGSAAYSELNPRGAGRGLDFTAC